MEAIKRIKSALISVYKKDEKIAHIAQLLSDLKINIFSSGGTYTYLESLGIKAKSVEMITAFPPILRGRVKTLHPKIFGGILARRGEYEDLNQLKKYEIPEIDLVIVDLYPFEETIKTTDVESEIIEQIDVGGISLIRAAAKNYNDVLVISSSKYYNDLETILKERDGYTNLDERKTFAINAFGISSNYDMKIHDYFKKTDSQKELNISIKESKKLRYGENPHQQANFYGNIEESLKQISGKELSYNNLIDIDSAINLINDFDEPTIAIIKHTNACGLASDKNLKNAWTLALAGDPLSAYGGIIISNRELDESTASEINKLFYEIIIAPSYNKNILEILAKKKNRIILQNINKNNSIYQYKSVLNGILSQEKDNKTESLAEMNSVTTRKLLEKEKADLVFANKIVKHNKSNSIVIVKNKQLIGIGTGQTSRVDAVEQAILKAKKYGHDLEGSVLASDAFFPFADCVEIAQKAGIIAVIQPGGSIRDNETLEYCNKNNLSMVITGFRHFKH